MSLNTYVTTKISYANTISQLADKVGANARVILDAGSDTRVGKKYLGIGAEYAGPCFPRDNKALINFLNKKKSPSFLPKATDDTNASQWRRIKELIDSLKLQNLQSLIIGFAGLSYKDNSSFIENSPSINFIKKYKKNTEYVYFDKYVEENDAIKIVPKIKKVMNLQELLEVSDIIILTYTSKNFQIPDKLLNRYKKTIIDLWGVNKNSKYVKTLGNL